MLSLYLVHMYSLSASGNVLILVGLESLQIQIMLTQWLFVLAASCIARVHSVRQVSMYVYI